MKMKNKIMNYREENFIKKFNSASRHFGVKPNEIISLKIREMVNSYSEYHEFLRVLEHEAGIKYSPIKGEMQGQGYLLTDGDARVIIVEHESGLEILYIIGSVASIVGIVPLVLQGWRAFRRRHIGRNPFADERAVEIRKLDEKGHLCEDHHHDSIVSGIVPLNLNPAFTTTAKKMENELLQLSKQIHSLTRRLEALEKQKTKKKVSKRKKSAR
jgi:hypothetical protein